jgi:long-chain acyl-CoA synthetase
MYNGAFQKASQKLIGKAIGGAKKVTDFFGGNGDRLRARIVGKFLKKALGGRVRFAVSGGAALKSELADFFTQNVGIIILEGYGLTETSPVLTCNRPEIFQYGTVGVPVPGVEVKLSEEGEIIARGPNIMKGYLGMPEKTAEAIDEDGWFHTGDLGGWTPEGLLRITGRKKLQFKLSNGEYVSPETVEKAMKHELVAQSMVGTPDMDYASALVFPDLPALRTRAGMMGIEGTDEELCAHPQIIQVYQDQVINPGNAQVPYTLTVEAGELTPTMKLKRGVLTEKFAADIASLYE